MENALQSSHGNHEVWQTTVDGSGRVLVPAELRQEMNATKGTTLLWVRSGNQLQLKTFEQSIRDIQDYYQKLAPAEDVWSDDVMARRKREAAHE